MLKLQISHAREFYSKAVGQIQVQHASLMRRASYARAVLLVGSEKLEAI